MRLTREAMALFGGREQGLEDARRVAAQLTRHGSNVDGPVSYTHLDVYKRQEMVRSMLSESLRAVISQTLLKTKDGNGRVAAHEIMIGTPAIRNLIRENKVAQMYSAIQTGQNFGMQTLDQNPVSYTHLDVYKRQGPDWLGRLRPDDWIARQSGRPAPVAGRARQRG